MKVTESFVTWTLAKCPECKEKNWVYSGDPQDLTGEDPHIIRCWNCLKVFALFEDDLGFDQDEDPVNGLKTPK